VSSTIKHRQVVRKTYGCAQQQPLYIRIETNSTPIDSLWLVGDSTHPGEGNAGVSYSALTVVRQIDQWLMSQ
jgi:phytoene dehydrogenase-like protein